ncbi:MAG: metalloregulator ArsR/SmtB family transcription factor [Endomicrobium sp.]|nr:metalloregulator ArsR/SmtB family transcription factor [Endomicrobium sp.]
MERAKETAELLKILANENRLLILCSLMQKEKNACDILKEVPKISQSALSQHLTLLRAAGILKCEKNGLNVKYTIADKRTADIIKALKKYYCKTSL